MSPQPGDIILVRTGSKFGIVIRWAQRRMGYAGADWDHAGLCSRIGLDGTAYMYEASTSGVHETKIRNYHNILVVPQNLTGGRLQLALEDAQSQCGKPYGWLDDAAMVCLILGHRWGWVKRITLRTSTTNCSQLVARALWTAGIRKWGDPFWVVPAALYN